MNRGFFTDKGDEAICRKVKRSLLLVYNIWRVVSSGTQILNSQFFSSACDHFTAFFNWPNLLTKSVLIEKFTYSLFTHHPDAKWP